MLELCAIDPITATFSAHGAPAGVAEPILDVSLGALRGVSELARVWDGFRLDLGCLGDYPGTQGPPQLLAAIVELSRRERQCGLDPTDVILTHGALHGLGAALATLPAGTPVLFPQPAFGYPFAIAAARCTPVSLSWPVGAPVADLVDGVERRLDRLTGPAAVIACFPSNPSGVSPSDREWRRLREIAGRNRALLVVDDLYRFAEPRALDVDGGDVVVIDSLSKRLGAPGLRLGWVSTSGARFSDLRAAAASTSVGVARPVAAIAEHALQAYLDEPVIASSVRDALAARRADVRAAVQAAGLAEHLLLTDAGFYGCIQLPGGDDVALTARLRGRGVAVTAGSSLYGPAAPEHVPFGAALPWQRSRSIPRDVRQSSPTGSFTSAGVSGSSAPTRRLQRHRRFGFRRDVAVEILARELGAEEVAEIGFEKIGPISPVAVTVSLAEGVVQGRVVRAGRARPTRAPVLRTQVSRQPRLPPQERAIPNDGRYPTDDRSRVRGGITPSSPRPLPSSPGASGRRSMPGSARPTRSRAASDRSLGPPSRHAFQPSSSRSTVLPDPGDPAEFDRSPVTKILKAVRHIADANISRQHRTQPRSRIISQSGLLSFSSLGRRPTRPSARVPRRSDRLRRRSRSLSPHSEVIRLAFFHTSPRRSNRRSVRTRRSRVAGILVGKELEVRLLFEDFFHGQTRRTDLGLDLLGQSVDRIGPHLLGRIGQHRHFPGHVEHGDGPAFADDPVEFLRIGDVVSIPAVLAAEPVRAGAVDRPGPPFLEDHNVQSFERI